jgi:glycine cleavage system H lipoate-binding protein
VTTKTGNSQEYANAVATDANEKVNDRRKKNWLAKLKKQSYQKAVQPVEDFAGNKRSDKAAMSPDEVMAATF